MIKVLLVDDHTILRDGLKQILADTHDIQVIAEAADANEALRLIEIDLDVIVLDVSMPGRSGLELLKQIKTDKPKLPVLILSMHSEDQYGIRAYRAGAAGYIRKDSAANLLVSAIRKVARGEMYISSKSAEKIAMELNGTYTDITSPHRLLSDREFQIFKMIAEGGGLTEIAGELSLSVKTVSTHKTNILEKMQLTGTADIVRYAIKHDLLDHD